MQSIVFYDDVHKASTTVNTGKTVFVNDATSLLISIHGTSTSFTIKFEGSLDGTNFFPIEGYKYNDSTISATQTSTKDEAWEFDVTLIKAFRANLTAIANNNISVVANGVYND